MSELFGVATDTAIIDEDCRIPMAGDARRDAADAARQPASHRHFQPRHRFNFIYRPASPARRRRSSIKFQYFSYNTLSIRNTGREPRRRIVASAGRRSSRSRRRAQ